MELQTKEMNTLIESIYNLEKTIITLVQQKNEKEYHLERLKNKMRGQVEGKNQTERDAALFYYLDTDEEYTHHKKKLKEVEITIQERKAELNYFENLFGSYKILIRNQYIDAIRRSEE